MIVAKSLRSVGRARALLYSGRKFTPLLGTTRTTLSYYSTSPPNSNASQSKDDFQSQGLIDTKGLTVFNTLHELQQVACTVFANNELFGTYNDSSGQFEYLTYADFGTKVEECRALLRHLGVSQYDKIGIISNNRYEWAMIACAAFSLNASLVPMYEAQLPSDWAYIINDSGASVLFCSTQEIFDRVHKGVLPMTPHVHSVLCLDGVESGSGRNNEDYTYQTAIDRIRQHNNNFHDVAGLATPPTPDDLASIIYTSGTTGKPKGVELTHMNFTSNIKGGRLMSKNPHELVSESDRTLAFLPWAHSYGQTVELWMGLSFGASMALCRGIPKILEDLEMVKPTILFAVPTLYKKVYDGVQHKMQSGSSIQNTLLKTAIDLGKQNAEFVRGERGPLSYVDQLRFSFLDKLVLSKIRDRFGGRMRFGCVAGAACPVEVLHFMDAVGIPICEGYGLTETSPIITMNVPGNRSIGSVGRALQDVTVYIIDTDGNVVAPGEEGEICCVGPNVMKGYHNNSEATSEVISTAPDGKSRMFHTGDIGSIDEQGWLKVTGRIKEQYKLENGKYVVPTPIENAIIMSRFIHQVVLVGANRPYNVALIVPEWTAIRSELDIDESVPEEDVVNDERVQKLIEEEIRQSCAKLKKFEIPQKWVFVAPFTLANNMITQKTSVRRLKVIEAYSDVISHMYGDDPVVSEAADGEGHHKVAA